MASPVSIREHKIYQDGKPIEYRIVVDQVEYRYYPGKGSVYCKSKGYGVMPCKYLLDLESGKIHPTRGPDDITPEWRVIRDKFKAFA